MGPIDIIILAAVAAAFVAVVLRIRKKGTCGDCSGGSCASCASGSRRGCPACGGVDEVAERLSAGMDRRTR